MAMSRVLLFFIFSLSALVGSINGRRCGTPTSEDLYRKQEEMYRKQMEASEESSRRMGRIGLECETYNTGGSGNTGSSPGGINLVLGFLILFFMFATPIVICIACCRRQKAINAANLNNSSGAQGTDLKSYPVQETNTVQKGDPGYKV